MTSVTAQDLQAVGSMQQEIAAVCQAPLSEGISRVVDAASLYSSLYKIEQDASTAQARLMAQDFGLLTPAEQAFYYQLLAQYALQNSQTKTALTLTHLLTDDVLVRLNSQQADTLKLAIADIHFTIQFYQSVRELLTPLLNSSDLILKMRAAILLWYSPQSQQQLEQSLAVIEQYQQLPETLLKVNAMEVLVRNAILHNQKRQAEALLNQALQLTRNLGATRPEIDLMILADELQSPLAAGLTTQSVAMTQLSTPQQLAITEVKIKDATAQQQWQRASQLHDKAIALRKIIDRNKALAREYASFQMVEQARQLTQAQQQSRLQALATEKQKQQRIIYILVLISALLGLAVLTLLFIKKRKAADYFERLANTDGLTQVLNRRAIQHFAEQVLARSKQLNQTFVVALADIDHFKSINDTYGHDAGDIVLTEFARRTSALIRQQDRLGRWGGEEWLIIMTNTQLDAVEGLFKRMQAEIHKISAADHELTVTFSMGAVSGNGNTPVESLIQAADTLLYKAKHSGRNQLCITDDP